MNKITLPVIIMVTLINVNAQSIQDTLSIKEVVITGHYSLQSIKKSLYKVGVLKKRRLEKNGGKQRGGRIGTDAQPYHNAAHPQFEYKTLHLI